MINNAIARRYAKALVQLAAEAGTIDSFTRELQAVDALFAGSCELQAALANPAITADQKRRIMHELILRLQCSELISNFMMLLVDKNRTALVSEIISTYMQLADEYTGVIRPVVTTAFPLDDTQVAAIQEALEKKSGKKVIPRVVLDNSLIGGVVTQIGDIAYDNSVKTQLAQINDILKKG